jgi:hypothetical protein
LNKLIAMKYYQVVSVEDDKSIKITPLDKTDGDQSFFVTIHGLENEEGNKDEISKIVNHVYYRVRLESLLQGKTIAINPFKKENDISGIRNYLADVFLNGTNVVRFFPEFEKA